MNMLDTLSALKTNTPEYNALLTNTHTFYSDSFEKLLWVLGITFVIFPILIEWYKKQNDKTYFNNFKKEMQNQYNSEINKFKSELEANLNTQLELNLNKLNDKIASIDNKMESVENNSICTTFFLLAIYSHDALVSLTYSAISLKYCYRGEKKYIVEAILENVIHHIKDVLIESKHIQKDYSKIVDDFSSKIGKINDILHKSNINQDVQRLADKMNSSMIDLQESIAFK